MVTYLTERDVVLDTLSSSYLYQDLASNLKNHILDNQKIVKTRLISIVSKPIVFVFFGLVELNCTKLP